jgi:ketosteroid isomerase-like protein
VSLPRRGRRERDRRERTALRQYKWQRSTLLAKWRMPSRQRRTERSGLSRLLRDYPLTCRGARSRRARYSAAISEDNQRAMSQENVETVERAIAALNERDIDRYLSCCTDEVQLSTPLAEIGGSYEGRDAMRRFFTDLNETSPDFHLVAERVEAIGTDRVLAFLRVTATGRASGIPAAVDTPSGNVYDFAGGKIARIRVFLDRDQALQAAGLSR